MLKLVNDHVLRDGSGKDQRAHGKKRPSEGDDSSEIYVATPLCDSLSVCLHFLISISLYLAMSSSRH